MIKNDAWCKVLVVRTVLTVFNIWLSARHFVVSTCSIVPHGIMVFVNKSTGRADPNPKDMMQYPELIYMSSHDKSVIMQVPFRTKSRRASTSTFNYTL